MGQQVFDESQFVQLVRDRLARTVSLVIQIAHFDREIERAFFQAGLAIDQKRGEIVMIVENRFEQRREAVVLFGRIDVRARIEQNLGALDRALARGEQKGVRPPRE